jgi:hypothetical protein
MKRTLQRLLAVTACVAGFGVLTTAPAQAAPYWQTYRITSTWTCGDAWGGSASGMRYKGCVVVNARSHAQSVVIVWNPTNRSHSLQANEVKLYKASPYAQVGTTQSCLPSRLSPGLSRACFGATRPVPTCNQVRGIHVVTVAGEIHNYITPWRRTPCRPTA